MRRVVAWALSGLLVAGLGGLGGGGWYYSDQVLPAPVPDPPALDTEVVDVDPAAGSVTLATTDGDLVDLDTVGLVAEGGTLVLDGPPERSGTTTTRRATLVDGTWPRTGDDAAASVATYVGDPAAALGLPYEPIEVASDLGRLPAWRVVPNRARTDTWVVIVHGRGSTLDQGNRLLPTLAELGLPSLSVSVRDDPGTSTDPVGADAHGERDWAELQAAVDHLRAAEDARRVVLVGYGHGASSVLSFLRSSGDRQRVSGAVLISPLLSMQQTLILHAQQRAVPGVVIPPLLAATRWFCSWRADLDLDEFEHLEATDRFAEVPMLVTHGDADTVVPVDASRELAALGPDHVVYEEYPGVGHAREWNADPARFAADLRDFLDDAVPVPAS